MAVQPTFDDIARATGTADLLIPPLIVGDWLSSILYGVNLCLVAFYFSRYGLRDLKVNAIAVCLLTVLWLMIMGTTLARDIHIGWYGDYALILLRNDVLAKLAHLLSVLPAGVTQSLLIYRWLGLTGHRRWAIVLWVAVAAVNIWGITVDLIPSDVLPRFNGESSTNGYALSTIDWEEVAVWGNFVLEVVLAVLLTRALWRGHSGGFNPRTDTMIRRLLTLTVSNSAIVCLLGLGEGISLHVQRGTNILVYVLASIAIPIYGICLLVNLLLRDRLRADLSSANGSAALRGMRTASTDDTGNSARKAHHIGAWPASEKTSASGAAGSFELYAPTNTLAPPLESPRERDEAERAAV